MLAQKYFIPKGAPDETVLYFIPCLSPTMAFADARGIPFIKEEGDKYFILEYNKINDIKIKKIYDLLSIPKLHDFMAEEINVTINNKKNNYLVRDLIQKYNESPLVPRFGIDANRDQNLALSSSNAFFEFIKEINHEDIPKFDMIKTTDKKNREEIAKEILDRKIRVFMIHGYNLPGRPFGPYWADENAKPKWKLATTFNDREHIKILIDKLDMVPIEAEEERKYIWPDAIDNPTNYRGEWLRRIYTECKIWTCDIELGSSNSEYNANKKENYYNEGVRTNNDDSYIASRIGNTTLKYLKTTKEDNNFLALLEKYPWK